ncbi:MAG: hypothetical protein Q9201_002809 [Fulgogasparrea decipioides]
MYAHVTHILKIGRNNFKPPPQVDSSVVRLVPKVPRPGIGFEEWDSMLRVCFGRKHRTLRAGWLGSRKTLEWVEGCWRSTCAMNGVPIDEDGAGAEEDMDVEQMDGGREAVLATGQEEEEWDGIMDVDDTPEKEDDHDELPDFFKQQTHNSTNGATASKRKKKGKVAELVREKVRKVLEDDTGFADRRAVTLDQNDFLRLLLAFNKEGIHFN